MKMEPPALPEIQVRRPFWKKGGFWCLLLVVAAFPYVWKEKGSLERRFRDRFLSQSEQLKLRARTAAQEAAQLASKAAEQAASKTAAETVKAAGELREMIEGDDGLPEEGTSASRLAAPDASPRMRGESAATYDPEGNVRKRRRTGVQMQKTYSHVKRGFRSAGEASAEGMLHSKRRSLSTPIAKGAEVQQGLYGFEGSRERGVAFFETGLGKGILMGLGFMAVFGLLGYVLLSINTKHAKTF